MKRPLVISVMVLIVLAAAGFLLFLLRGPARPGDASRQDATVPERELSPEVKQVRDAAAALTEKGYDLKQEGKNGAALAAFEEALGVLLPHRTVLGEEVASSLDDQATIHLRTGRYDKARALYGRAMALLRESGLGDDDRLGRSIERRMATLEALETRGIVCSEPLSPPGAGEKSDGGVTRDASAPADEAMPYFPELRDMYDGFAKMRGDLRSCVDESLLFSPISVWMVVTGDGRVILSNAKHAMKGTPTGNCLESKLEAVAKKHRNDLPRFSACFRSFTYPFLFGK